MEVLAFYENQLVRVMARREAWLKLDRLLRGTILIIVQTPCVCAVKHLRVSREP